MTGVGLGSHMSTTSVYVWGSVHSECNTYSLAGHLLDTFIPNLHDMKCRRMGVHKLARARNQIKDAGMSVEMVLSYVLMLQFKLFRQLIQSHGECAHVHKCMCIDVALCPGSWPVTKICKNILQSADMLYLGLPALHNALTL